MLPPSSELLLKPLPFDLEGLPPPLAGWLGERGRLTQQAHEDELGEVGAGVEAVDHLVRSTNSRAAFQIAIRLGMGDFSMLPSSGLFP